MPRRWNGLTLLFNDWYSSIIGFVSHFCWGADDVNGIKGVNERAGVGEDKLPKTQFRPSFVLVQRDVIL